jgi:hypothetical protein
MALDAGIAPETSPQRFTTSSGAWKSRHIIVSNRLRAYRNGTVSMTSAKCRSRTRAAAIRSSRSTAMASPSSRRRPRATWGSWLYRDFVPNKDEAPVATSAGPPA